MGLNLSKCHNLIFKSNCTSHEIQLGEYEISEPNNEKDLEIVISKNFTWSANCEQRVSKAIGALFQVERNLSKSSSLSSKLNKYCGYILPIILNGSEVWKPTKTEL